MVRLNCTRTNECNLVKKTDSGQQGEAFSEALDNTSAALGLNFGVALTDMMVGSLFSDLSETGKLKCTNEACLRPRSQPIPKSIAK
eukprot:1576116-Amphidinium_carterae.1